MRMWLQLRRDPVEVAPGASTVDNIITVDVWPLLQPIVEQLVKTDVQNYLEKLYPLAKFEQ